jgi:hypothetical protein
MQLTGYLPASPKSEELTLFAIHFSYPFWRESSFSWYLLPKKLFKKTLFFKKSAFKNNFLAKALALTQIERIRRQN